MITIPMGQGSATVPDAICSMFDEDIFCVITDTGDVYEDGESVDVVTSAGPYKAVFFNHVARVYFDQLYFTDFSTAAKTVNITAPFTWEFQAIPKKSIGDVPTSGIVLLPFFRGLNVVSLPYDKDLYINHIGDEVVDTVPVSHCTKKYIGNPNRYGESENSLVFAKPICTGSIYFEWIDDDGCWRSWYFKKVETKTAISSNANDIVKNISENYNERMATVQLKKNTISEIYTSGNETKDILKILNSIKSSSFVFRGLAKERVNVKSEDTTDIDRIKEFTFTILTETKTAR